MVQEADIQRPRTSTYSLRQRVLSAHPNPRPRSLVQLRRAAPATARRTAAPHDRNARRSSDRQAERRRLLLGTGAAIGQPTP